jgi:hypothetical protein
MCVCVCIYIHVHIYTQTDRSIDDCVCVPAQIRTSWCVFTRMRVGGAPVRIHAAALRLAPSFRRSATAQRLIYNGATAIINTPYIQWCNGYIERYSRQPAAVGPSAVHTRPCRAEGRAPSRRRCGRGRPHGARLPLDLVGVARARCNQRPPPRDIGNKTQPNPTRHWAECSYSFRPDDHRGHEARSGRTRSDTRRLGYYRIRGTIGSCSVTQRRSGARLRGAIGVAMRCAFRPRRPRWPGRDG